MSFRRTQNAHDQWLSYCQKHERAVNATGLPADLFGRADLLQRFLHDGSFLHMSGRELLLSQIPDASFVALEQFINGYFDFQDAFPALQKERLRRFHRHG